MFSILLLQLFLLYVLGARLYMLVSTGEDNTYSNFDSVQDQPAHVRLFEYFASEVVTPLHPCL